MRTWLIFAVMLFASQTAIAAESAPSGPAARGEPRPPPSPITDRFYLRGIYFQPSVTTDLRFDDDSGALGTELSAEEDLAMDDQLNQGRMELMFRMRPRHRMRVDFLKVDRFGDAILDRTIQFGDETFNVNERVQSSLDWRMLGFTYTFSPVRFRRFELGTGLGIYLIEAEARGEVRERFVSEEESQGGAAPTLALDAAWAITRRFSATARVQHLSLEIDDFDATLTEYHADVQFRWRPNLAFGVGYTAMEIDVEAMEQGDSGLFKLDVSGPEVFFRVSF